MMQGINSLNDLRSPLTEPPSPKTRPAPTPKVASPKFEGHRPLAPGELPIEDIYALDPESLIAYCEQRRQAPPVVNPVTWRQAAVLGTAAVCGVALMGYQAYHYHAARSTGWDVSGLVPPPFAPLNATDLAPF